LRSAKLAIQWCPAKRARRPTRSGSVSRAVASAPDLGYAAAPGLPARGCRVWTQAALNAYLRSPEELAPGTAVTSVGLPDSGADVIGDLAAGNRRVEE
jgi:cytochrome c2